MYEINNVNKRLRTIRHFSNYILVALVITVLTAIIVLAANGYDIDRKTGQVIQNGILLLETEPEGAMVTINGVEESAQTPAKYPVPEGRYELEIEKDDYRRWSSTVDVFGSRVNWIYYPQLVPQTINTTIVNTVTDLNTFAYNKQRDTILLGRSTNPRSLVVYDLSGNTISSTPYTIPDRAFRISDGELDGSLTFTHLSNGGRYAIFDYVGSNFKDTVLVDLDDQSRTFNLDTRYGQNFEAVTVEDGVLHIVNESEYFRVPVSAQVLPESERQGVEQVVHENGNTYLISRNITGRRFLASLNTETTLLEIPQSSSVIRGEWEGTRFTAVSSEKTVQIYGQLLGQIEPLPEKVITTDEPVISTVASPGDRLIAVQTESTTEVYDLDTKRTYSIDKGTSDKAVWLDDFRLAYSDEDQLYVMDFTGENRYQIASYDDSYPAFADTSGEFIYTISHTTVDDSLVLRASSMRVDE